VVTRARTSKLTAPTLSQADVEALSAARNEPAWLLESRLAAWKLYAEMPMPSLQAEEWRRTDYTKIRWEDAGHLLTGSTAGFEAIPAENRAPLIGERQGGLIAAVDGRIVHNELSDELRKQGIIFTDLDTAVRDYESLVRPNLMTKAVRPGEGKFAALHAALWTHGVFLYVPRGCKVELPLHSIFYNTLDGMTLGHIIVILEENAEAVYLNEYLSAPGIDRHAAYVGATELLVGDNANLKFVSLQDWGRTSMTSATSGRASGAAPSWTGSGHDGQQADQGLQRDRVDGEGCWAHVRPVLRGCGSALLDHDTQQNHNAPSTTSDLLFKGALKHASRTVWQGMIKVLPHAQKTDGFQANRNLVLSQDARADSIPGLEIEANDVRCTHAATIGKLEEEPIFYLMSRGMPRAEAERLIVRGFFDPIMERIPFPEVRERLGQHIEDKLLGIHVTA
jgi:Fe-S cluster assembly protein SufD